MPQKKILIWSVIVFIYFFISWKLLIKDPGIFPDETVLANLSYSFINSDNFGSLPFDKKFSVIEPVSITHNPYPILYNLILMVPIKLFGLNVYVIRIIPLIFGFLSLILVFLIIEKISKKSYLGLLGMFLLAIDMNFLRCVRFGRVDSAALFFGLFLIYLYLQPVKKIFWMVIISLCGIFTHFLIGSLATIAIVLHILFTKIKTSKLLVLGIVGVILLIIFLAILNFLNIDWRHSLIVSHLTPSLHSTRLIMNDNFTFNKFNFLLYFLVVLVFLCFSKKTKILWFWFLYSLIVLFFVFIGNSFFYIFYIPVVFIPLLVMSELAVGWFLIAGLIIMSVFQHGRLLKAYKNYNYYELGEKISVCIKKEGANVISGQLVPDPYLFLVSQRKDLNISYGNMNNFNVFFTEAFPKADYFIHSAYYGKIITDKVYLQSRENEKSKEQIDGLIKTNFGLEPRVAELLLKYGKDVCYVPGNGYYPDLAVFGLK